MMEQRERESWVRQVVKEGSTTRHGSVEDHLSGLSLDLL
jgi:hypothetical protein